MQDNVISALVRVELRKTGPAATRDKMFLKDKEKFASQRRGRKGIPKRVCGVDEMNSP